MLGHAEGDFLLILDCCYAAQSARDRNRVIPFNVELMAACAMNRQTRRPGPRSFTTAWIRVVQEVLDDKRPIIVREIAHSLMSASSNLPESPIYLPLGRDGSICLERSSSVSGSEVYGSYQASLSLEMLLRNPLDGDVFRRVIHWLGKSAPQDITGIDVLDLSERAVHLERFVLRDSRASNDAASGAAVTASYFNDLMSAWDGFLLRLENSMMASLSTLRTDRHPVPNFGQQQDQVKDFLRLFSVNVVELQRTVERVILCLPNLHDEELLRQKLDDPDLVAAGISQSLEVRLQDLTSTVASSFLSTRPVPETVSAYDKLSSVSISVHPRFGSIVTEHVEYDPNNRSFNERLICNRLDRLANVLKTAASTVEFCTPPCLGCTADDTGSKYGVVFQNTFSSPSGNVEFLSLYNILGLSASSGRHDPLLNPTLGQRFALALSLSRALHKWHCVGYLHQGIASYNIFLPRHRHSKKIDLARPLLLGFAQSRASDESSSYRPDALQVLRDTYRHPARQGWPPVKKHAKQHDVYGLGLLLLEIGLWEQIPLRFAHALEKKDVGRVGLGRYILQRAKGMLAFGMGAEYERAAWACISGEPFTGLRSDEGDGMAEWARTFEREVLKRLERGVDIDGKGDG